MPIYYPSTQLDPYNVGGSTYYIMGPLSNTQTTTQLSCDSVNAGGINYISPLYSPNINDAVSGYTFTMNLSLTVNNKNITIFLYPSIIILGDNTSQLNIFQQGVNVNAGTSTVTLSASQIASYGNNCSYRLYVNITITTTQMSTQSITIGTDRSSTYFYTDLPTNQIGCRDSIRKRVKHLSYK